MINSFTFYADEEGNIYDFTVKVRLGEGGNLFKKEKDFFLGMIEERDEVREGTYKSQNRLTFERYNGNFHEGIAGSGRRLEMRIPDGREDIFGFYFECCGKPSREFASRLMWRILQRYGEVRSDEEKKVHEICVQNFEKLGIDLESL